MIATIATAAEGYLSHQCLNRLEALAFRLTMMSKMFLGRPTNPRLVIMVGCRGWQRSQ